MKVYTTLHIGEQHVNYCEDYLLTAELGENQILFAVMDGCSMGIDSYLPATLTGKLLRKIAKEIQYKEFFEKKSMAPAPLLKAILKQLFEEFRYLKNYLQLERAEVLNTLLMAVADTKQRTAEFICVGDGLIQVNDEYYEFEQDNKPDYLGYHLHEDFEDWFTRQQQRLSIQDIRNFSLCTDGIFTFSKFDIKSYGEAGDVIELLLHDVTGGHNSNMLNQKMIEIKDNWGLKPSDDLAIIRVNMD